MTGADLIAEERARQIHEKGWTAENDDRQESGELLECAVAIADEVYAGCEHTPGDTLCPESANHWPISRAFHVKKKYGRDHIRRLVIAGALIAAEIDRLQRAKA